MFRRRSPRSTNRSLFARSAAIIVIHLIVLIDKSVYLFAMMVVAVEVVAVSKLMVVLERFLSGPILQAATAAVVAGVVSVGRDSWLVR